LKIVFAHKCKGKPNIPEDMAGIAIDSCAIASQKRSVLRTPLKS